MKKILFIDRDGTLIVEPTTDMQVDSLDKLEFIPGVFRNLYNIQKLTDFELVIVSNQDGLGTPAYPEETFWPAQQMMLKAFENEGVTFTRIHIDPTFPEEKSPNRKPGTGMLKEYFSPDYDLAGSFVIGDRITDIELAKNLGARGLFFGSLEEGSKLKDFGLDQHCALVTDKWDTIFNFLAIGERTGTVSRKTAETDIFVELKLDGSGMCQVSTGLAFFDHMLDQIGRHSGCDLTIRVKGDLAVDEHHTIEDTGIALGEAIRKALGDKRGIERYGYCLPMDDCLAQVALDFGGRPWIVWNAEFKREKVGEMPTEMFYHFFKSLSDSALANLNIQAQGTNEHHKIEGIFKAFARALKMAIRKDPFVQSLPSTKGVL
ncbi:MAG: bifunctional histidinol-phosphatase/imidazoleglycerol-phosphate dehydratase HisB [Mariniphaga sp.]